VSDLSVYDPGFYAGQKRRSALAAETVAAILCAQLPLSSVLDVGCGLGGWLAAFARQGVPDIVGVDGPHVDRSALAIPQSSFIAHDLSEPLDLGRRFDLVVSIEVAEHLPGELAPRFVADLCRHGDLVLFSAAIPFQGGIGHVNEQWPSYWADFFGDQGFEPIDAVRAHIWDDERIVYWYKQNILLYARHGAILGLAPAALPALDVVHPTRYLEAADPDRMSLRRAVRGLCRGLRRRIRRALR
jgi:SAM-dependent methyltransferase